MKKITLILTLVLGCSSLGITNKIENINYLKQENQKLQEVIKQYREKFKTDIQTFNQEINNYKETIETQNKKLVIENYEDSYLEIKMLLTMLFCQNYLQNKNIPYCFTMVKNREAIKMGGSLQSYRDRIVDEIDWKKFYFVDGKYSFSDYAKFTNAQRSSDGQHWGSEYHKTFGKLMKKYIETNNENMLL